MYLIGSNKSIIPYFGKYSTKGNFIFYLLVVNISLSVSCSFGTQLACYLANGNHGRSGKISAHYR